jgi:3-oxoadipate enol-lactonase
MPIIDADGCPIHVEVDGPDRAPALMLSNSLGTTLQMWDAQIAPFARQFRVIRYDRRGHGGSGVAKGPYTMERLGRDVLAVLDGLGIQRTHWCGLSMGGMVGMWLAANAPGRIERLILSNTSSHYPDKSFWNDRIRAIRDAGGIAALADRIVTLWFTKDFRDRDPAAVARLKAMLAATPTEGYVACCEAVRDMDHRALLAAITAPTLVIAGRHDQATPLAAAEFIQNEIPGAALAVLETAHIANVEQPDRYRDTVLGFLNG